MIVIFLVLIDAIGLVFGITVGMMIGLIYTHRSHTDNRGLISDQHTTSK